MMYHVPCACGKRVRVELFQAGTTAQCPSCHSAVAIPGSTRLKELSGDRYPHLSPIDKVLTTLERGEPPFDGTCHGCGDRAAEFRVPVRFSTLVERHVPDDRGVRVGAIGVSLVRAATEEQWRTINFPLLLCSSCSDVFQSDRSASSRSSFVRSFVLVAIYFGVATAGTIFLTAIFSLQTSAFISFGTATVVASRLMYSKGARQGNETLKDWLQRIPWVSDLITVEDEYTLSSGEVCRIIDR